MSRTDPDARAPSQARVLDASDRSDLEGFLAEHAASTMFMRSNLRASGMTDAPSKRFEATYAAAIDASGEIVAAASHNWNGVLLVVGGEGAADAARLAIQRSGLDIRGVSGDLTTAEHVLDALGLRGQPTTMDAPEYLYELALDELRVPNVLRQSHVECRPPREEEFEQLVEWRLAYHLWMNGSTDDEVAKNLRLGLRQAIEHDRTRVLEVDGELVSHTSFNAVLPDQVQVGGVWTPPEHRGRGYARSVVAGHLLDAREDGVRDALLFTAEDNTSAQAAYEAIGFEQIGRFALVLFDGSVDAAVVQENDTAGDE